MKHMNYSKIFDDFKKANELKTEYLNTKINICNTIQEKFPNCLNNSTQDYSNIRDELLFLLSTLPNNKSSRYIIYKEYPNKDSYKDLVWRFPHKDFYYIRRDNGGLSEALYSNDYLIKDNKIYIKRKYSNAPDILIDLLKLPKIDVDRAKEFIGYMDRFKELNLNEIKLKDIEVTYRGEILFRECYINNVVDINDSSSCGSGCSNRFVKDAKEHFSKLLIDNNKLFSSFIKQEKEIISNLVEAETIKSLHKINCRKLLEELVEYNSAYKILKDL